MDRDPDDRLIAALARTADSVQPWRGLEAVENLVGEFLGARTRRDFRDRIRAPDFVLATQPDQLIAIELKVLSDRSLGKNLGNRVSDLLASAVEIRRSYPHEITLSAIVLIARSEGVDRSTADSIRLVSRLRAILRREDGVGFDSVLVGSAADRLEWSFIRSRVDGPLDGDIVRPEGAPAAFALIKNQQVTASLVPPRRPAQARRMLLVADEWRSSLGGITTVNRELAVALARVGVDVAVMVPRASESDIRAASDLDVALVTPARVPGLNDRETLLLRPVFAEADWHPDVVIGHGRVLGPYAASQQQEHFPSARRVHFVHTDSEQLEAAKEMPGGRSNMVTAEERRLLERALARSADLVVGVGPLLTETIRDELIGPGTPPRVISFIPGLRSSLDTSSGPLPIKNRVLLVGRADDFQSKGIDIAGEAMLRVVDGWGGATPHPPGLVIRGVPDEAANDVKNRLDEIFEGRVDYALRPYSDSEEEVFNDLAQARVLLMPSRHEGFGLSAYEAIAAAVPVLISSKSGLAQFLREAGVDSNPSSVVPVGNAPGRLAADRWAEEIQKVLQNPLSARARAVALRAAVSSVAGWPRSVTDLLSAVDAIT